MVLAEKGYKVTAAAKGAYEGGADGSGLGGAITTGDLSRKPAAGSGGDTGLQAKRNTRMSNSAMCAR